LVYYINSKLQKSVYFLHRSRKSQIFVIYGNGQVLSARAQCQLVSFLDDTGTIALDTLGLCEATECHMVALATTRRAFLFFGHRHHLLWVIDEALRRILRAGGFGPPTLHDRLVF